MADSALPVDDPSSTMSATGTPSTTSSPLNQFLGGFKQSAGGDIGNFFSGYRDMRGQIAETQLKQAETQDLSARAEHQRMLTQSAKKQAETMQRLAQQRAQQQNTLSTQEQKFLDLSSALFDSGEFQGATKALDVARQIEATRSTAAHQSLQDEALRSEAVQQKADSFEQLASGVTDQMTMEAAKVAWEQRFPGGQNPFSGVYDKASFDGMRATTKAGMERAKSALTQKDMEEKLKHYQALDERLKNRNKYDDKMLELREKEDKLKAKGGSPIKYGGIDLSGHAEDALKKQFPNLSPDNRKTFGWELAQRVEKLVATNKMGRDEALQQAIGDRRQELDELNADRKEHGGLMGWINDLMSSFSSKPKESTTPEGGPVKGSVWDGHVYLGGDPAKKSSWRAATSEEDSGGPEATDDETGEAVNPEDIE